MTRRFTLILFLFCLMPLFMSAQPQGCKHSKQKITLSPLTPQEQAVVAASNSRSDTIDVLNYDITMEVINFSQGIINANTTVTFSPKMENIEHLALDLLELDIDSVLLNGVNTAFSYDGLVIDVFFPAMSSNDTSDVTVYYHGQPEVDPSGFGGFDFRGGYAYNLGIGLSSNPYNFGRSWHPCFDNFVERATYDFNIISKGIYKGYCVGTFIEEVPLQGDTLVRRYKLDQPIPTYLAGVAVADYAEYNEVHEGFYGPVDIQLVARAADLNSMINTFATLTDAVDALEYWYGPYVWDRVGYVTTVVGAMEHPGNIAYPEGTGLEGDDFAHKRLMSHELCHCWFGDIVTLSSPADMWFKEGNAEYGAHLFTEYLLGREAFIDQVKDNFVDEVLRKAHFEDGDFLPLSGIPFENTYGTHTYQKGASMIHNMRAYLGDSLFRAGQTSMLNAYAYSAVDAATYRDHLTSVTGVDMTSFFDDWIYAPGFSAYEIDSVQTVPSGSEYEATVYIQQKLRAAPHFHTNTPIEVTFMDDNWNQFTTQVMVSEEFTAPTVNVPFEPTLWFLNGNNKLNLAVVENTVVVDQPINRTLSYADIQIVVSEVTDSTLLRAEHYWVAPDAIGDNPFNATMSTTHYWHIDGLNLEGMDATATFTYSGQSRPFLDEALVATTEDSLILVYRLEAGAPWIEHPNYIKVPLLPTDGSGFITVNEILPGDYAFANGELPLVNTKDIFQNNQVRLFPNPASDYITIENELSENPDRYRIFDVTGKLFLQGTFESTIKVNALENGVYVLLLLDQEGRSMGAKQFEILR